MAVKAICAKPTAAINTRDSTYRCEMANAASAAQKTVPPTSICCTLGFLLFHANQSADRSDPIPKDEDMKPKPVGPACKTSVAKSGSTTLKLMPKIGRASCRERV